mgnify:CR=1 FL=1
MRLFLFFWQDSDSDQEFEDHLKVTNPNHHLDPSKVDAESNEKDNDDDDDEINLLKENLNYLKDSSNHLDEDQLLLSAVSIFETNNSKKRRPSSDDSLIRSTKKAIIEKEN